MKPQITPSSLGQRWPRDEARRAEASAYLQRGKHDLATPAHGHLARVPVRMTCETASGLHN